MTDDAQDVLLKCAADPTGRICFRRTLGPVQTISIGGTEFKKYETRRELARWEAAIDELKLDGFMQHSSFGGQHAICYELTHAGFSKADELQGRS